MTPPLPSFVDRGSTSRRKAPSSGRSVTETDSQPARPEPDEAKPALGRVSFDNLDPTQFEEFCCDLLGRVGFINLDWRKGTALSSSPADQGRDIEATRVMDDLDGHVYHDLWFVDAKHYRTSVPPETLNPLLSRCFASRPAVALVIASGYLSNPAKNYLRDYVANNNPPFRIRYWERPALQTFIESHPSLIEKHGISVEPRRTSAELDRTFREYRDLMWYSRIRRDMDWAGDTTTEWEHSPEVQQRMEAVEYRFDEEQELLGPLSSRQMAYLEGRLSALEWMHGAPWEPMALEMEQRND